MINEKVEKVVNFVNEIRLKMPRLGGKKLYHLLRIPLQGLKIGRDKFFDILRANRLLIKPKRQYHVTTDSHHRFKKHKNLIESLKIEKPEQVLVSDITYVGNRNYPMYLSLVTDAYSKKIMGYNLSKSLDAQGANSALKMAIKNLCYSRKDLIHHSDRGVQYCCNLYQQTLKKENIQCSMTEQYDPYQNAVAERINGILKQEFDISDNRLNKEEIIRLTKQSIKIYNEMRPHFSCNLMTPNQAHLEGKFDYKKWGNFSITEIWN